MKTILFVHGGKVEGRAPIAHFLLRLQAAVDYYEQHSSEQDIIFFVSGRWTNVTDDFDITEAEVGKRWIKERLPNATIATEDISVQLIGNFAFSKPLLTALNPDNVIILTSELLLPRTRTIAGRIIADAFPYDIQCITSELMDNPLLVEREVCATNLFTRVFQNVADGDDAGFRDTLLYQTPWYFKGLIDDKAFCDKYWDGGFEHFLNSRTVRKTLA